MIKKKVTTLSIIHNIFLTRKERYAIHEGKKVTTVGVSLPVWFRKGSTSEPAEEVFCEYTIINEAEVKPIQAKKNGYIINVPQLPGDYEPRSLTNKKWRKMSLKERADWYNKNPVPVSSKSLLDLIDLGSKHLSFKITQDADASESEVDFNILHFIVIQDQEVLKKSLTADR